MIHMIHMIHMHIQIMIWLNWSTFRCNCLIKTIAATLIIKIKKLAAILIVKHEYTCSDS